MLRFDGKKDTARRDAVERGEVVRLDVTNEPGVQTGLAFRAWIKTVPTYAVRVTVPFEVDTLEGLHVAKEGDYLAIGAHGEMYPIDAEVFEATYQPMRG